MCVCDYFFLTFLSNFYFFVILYEWHSDGAYDRVLYFDIPVYDIEYVNSEGLLTLSKIYEICIIVVYVITIVPFKNIVLVSKS